LLDLSGTASQSLFEHSDESLLLAHSFKPGFLADRLKPATKILFFPESAFHLQEAFGLPTFPYSLGDMLQSIEISESGRSTCRRFNPAEPLSMSAKALAGLNTTPIEGMQRPPSRLRGPYIIVSEGKAVIKFATSHDWHGHDQMSCGR